MDKTLDKQRLGRIGYKYKKKTAENKCKRVSVELEKNAEQLLEMDIHTALASSQIAKMTYNHSVAKEIIAKQILSIADKLEKEGITAFIPDAEASLLMCIKGFHTIETTYNRLGDVDETKVKFVPPNPQAAIAFLKVVAPEKYSTFDSQNQGDSYCIINNNIIQQDIDRISNIAGSLLTKKIESTQIENAELNETEQPGASQNS